MLGAGVIPLVVGSGKGEGPGPLPRRHVQCHLHGSPASVRRRAAQRIGTQVSCSRRVRPRVKRSRRLVLFTAGLVHAALLNSTADVWIQGDTYGLIIAADTADRSVHGRRAQYLGNATLLPSMCLGRLGAVSTTTSSTMGLARTSKPPGCDGGEQRDDPGTSP